MYLIISFWRSSWTELFKSHVERRKTKSIQILYDVADFRITSSFVILTTLVYPEMDVDNVYYLKVKPYVYYYYTPDEIMERSI